MTAVSIATAAWMSANTAAYWRYRSALRDPGAIQAAILKRYLRANADTIFGRRYGFSTIASVAEYQARVPISSYSDFSEAVAQIARGDQRVLTSDRVRTLAVSSGSVSAAKRIPYTRRLQEEFRRAIAPWILDLYRNDPELAFGCSYWSITPVAGDRSLESSAVRVGFEEDSEYLGRRWKRLVDRTLAVPGAVRFVRDIDAFRYVTLLFLLQRPDLRLVSVWHPSFLTLLLGTLSSHWESLVADVRRGTVSPPSEVPADVRNELRAHLRPNPRRADELTVTGPCDCASIWPRLRLVSCWADGHSRFYIDGIKRILPHVRIQPKGLLATEAVVTLPFQGLTPLAIRSHFFEFLRDGRVATAQELEPGKVYTVIVTTGGGLYRYLLDDRVEVNGFVRNTPSLRFLGKEDHVSDLCGEKLNETFVARALHDACGRLGVAPRFALVAPDVSTRPPCYTLYVESDGAPPGVLGPVLDQCLAANPHYRYCRTLGQLGPLRVCHASIPLFPLYLQRCRDLGQRLGDVKPLALSTKSGWADVFELPIESYAAAGDPRRI